MSSSIQATPGVQEQLMILKGLTKTTMVVHEAQVLQLKSWGKIAVGFLDKLKFNVDPEKKFVEYYGKPPARMPPRVARRFEVLERNVQWLFGDDWQLRVKSGSKVIFRSTALKADHDDDRTSERERN